MIIDWEHFTFLQSLAGGVLIGLAATMLILLNGQVAGISGIVGKLFDIGQQSAWRFAFVIGLLLSPYLYSIFSPLPAPQFESGWPIYLIAGVTVGLGSRLGSGCTSGHGVCGLSRLSKRSLVATLVFMGTGFATVFVARHLIGG
ncbi:MAG: YeeE/YedE family protein [Betaproteobacteria bacterium]|nr:YeeE/YedE family protein [Betaproteobacteria bacterium]